MKAIRTAPRVRIDQRRLQVVFAEKPRECTHRSLRPLLAVIRAARGEARENRGRCLDRLLIEGIGLLTNPAKALGANRSEASRWCGLERRQPTERFEAGLHIPRRIGRQTRLNHRLRKARIVVGENVFKPEPILALVCDKQGH